VKLFLLFSLFVSFVSAQTYEEYLHSQEEAFSSYKDERDKEFSSFLNKEWKVYKASQGLSAYEEEKPKKISIAKKQKVIQLKKRIDVVLQPLEKKKTKSYQKIIIRPDTRHLKMLYTSYFGVELVLHYDASVLFSTKGSVSKESIKKAWDHLAKSKYETVLKELNEISSTLKLNDWGRYQLVRHVASKLYLHSNEALLFSWFTLLKMDYDARIAFQNHRVILLLPVRSKLYSTVYYSFNNKKYYALDYYAKGTLGSVMSYDNVYKGARKSLDFRLTKQPLFASKPVVKQFHFEVDNHLISLSLKYDENLLHFFQTYPQVSYEDYFSSLDANILKHSIKASFRPLLEGKSESEALDLLLSFVQHAFKYKVDTEQFDKEKVMFASETIFYPYSDCEDRAILFSYLVKVLLDKDVVGLKYTDHMSTAVFIDEKVKGEYIRVKKRNYIVADPTYVNARLGMSQPKYFGIKPYLIDSTGGEK